LREKAHLGPADGEARQKVVLPEQPISNTPHVQEVFGIGANAAANPENALDQERRLESPPLNKIGQIIEVADVIALELETRPAAIAKCAYQGVEHGERIRVNRSVALFEIGSLPVEFPIGTFRGELPRAEVHRAHVQAR